MEYHDYDGYQELHFYASFFSKELIGSIQVNMKEKKFIWTNERQFDETVTYSL